MTAGQDAVRVSLCHARMARVMAAWSVLERCETRSERSHALTELGQAVEGVRTEYDAQRHALTIEADGTDGLCEECGTVPATRHLEGAASPVVCTECGETIHGIRKEARGY